MTDADQAPALTRSVSLTLAYGMLISAIGNNFLITILPPIGREMGFVEFQVGLILAVSGLFMLATGPLWGRVSESWGRKPVIMFGAIGYVFATVAFGLTIDSRLAGMLGVGTALALMLIVRGLYALTSGAIYPATMAVIADLTTRQERSSAVAYISAAWGFGAVVGPALAAIFSGFGATIPIYVVAIMAIAAVFLYMAYLHEPRRHGSPQAVSFRNILTAQVLGILSSFSVLILGNVALMVCLGFHLQDTFGLDAIQTTRYVGIAISASAVSQIVVQVYVIPRVGWSPLRMINVGMPIAIVAILLIWIASDYWVVVTAMIFFGLGGGFGWPACMTAASLAVGPDNQGNMAGLTMSFQALGFMIGPIVGTLAYQADPSYMFYVSTGLLIVMVVIANAIRMPHPDDL